MHVNYVASYEAPAVSGIMVAVSVGTMQLGPMIDAAKARQGLQIVEV